MIFDSAVRREFRDARISLRVALIYADQFGDTTGDQDFKELADKTFHHLTRAAEALGFDLVPINPQATANRNG